MDFRPQAGEKIYIDQSFVFMPHPAAPDFPYGQSGRRGTVYQVQLEIDGTFHAIKVFTELFQDPRNANTASRLISFAEMPGLQACYRKIITPEGYPNLLKQYPQLEYAVVMPWVEGETWYDFILAGEVLLKDQSLAVAKAFLHVLLGMEKRQMAHCDLSGANLLIQIDPVHVALVDVEELYSPKLKAPDPKKLPAGTPGYAHQTAAKGLWSRDADRFAGAVLLAEILAWSSPVIRQNASEAQYFDENEVQTRCMRYQLMRETLRREWGGKISDAFAQAWFSKRIGDCTSFQEWSTLLDNYGTNKNADPRADRPLIEQRPAQVVPPAVAPAVALDNTTSGGYYQQPIVRKPLLNNIRWAARPVTQPATSRRRTIKLLLIWMAAIIVIIVAVFAGTSLSQPRGTTSLQGKVVDQNGNGVDAAKVSLSGRVNDTTITNSKGEYTFTNLPEMDAKIQVKAEGYSESIPVPVDIPANGALDVQPIELSPAGIRVTGTILDGSTKELDKASVTITGTYTDNKESINIGPIYTNADGRWETIIKRPADLNITAQKSGLKKSKETKVVSSEHIEMTLLP